MSDTKTIHAALVAALAEVAVITKGRTADAGSYSYDYADLGDTVNVVQPRLAEHGIRVLTPVHGFEDRLACTVILVHESGEEIRFDPLPFPYGRDAQATGSMMTYYRRYALTAALGLGTADDDGAGAHAYQPPQPQEDPAVPGLRSSILGAIEKLDAATRTQVAEWIKAQRLPAVRRMNAAQCVQVLDHLMALPEVEVGVTPDKEEGRSVGADDPVTPTPNEGVSSDGDALGADVRLRHGWRVQGDAALRQRADPPCSCLGLPIHRNQVGRPPVLGASRSPRGRVRGNAAPRPQGPRRHAGRHHRVVPRLPASPPALRHGWHLWGRRVMAQPPTLFDVPVDPLPVRSTDPATSRAAARRLPLRKRKAQVMVAIEFIDSAGPSFIADEVLDVLCRVDPRWERGWVASRLSQLKRDGLVEACGLAAGRMGVDVQTFRLTAAGRAWLAGRA